MRAALFALLVLGMAATAGATGPPPQRIVSLNLCTDQIVIDLVEPHRIRALSHLATDARVSLVAARARAFPFVRADAETVLALDPDLIVTTEHSATATVSLLERLGRRVLRVPLVQDIAGVREAVARLASATGSEVAGQALIAALDARIRAVEVATPRAARRPTAVVYQIGGLASGPGTLEAEAMRIAGLDNHAARLRLGAGGRLDLEVLVSDPPDLIVLSGPSDEYRTVVAENLAHPALSALMRRLAVVVVPWRTWLCGTPAIADAIEALAAARRAIETRRP